MCGGHSRSVDQVLPWTSQEVTTSPHDTRARGLQQGQHSRRSQPANKVNTTSVDAPSSDYEPSVPSLFFMKREARLRRDACVLMGELCTRGTLSLNRCFD
eukprot:TRINITY_DN5232_c0_g1_i1.p1 TRINITY_DN5232_c0_g1~~TRINITY_DN5232_c0_g1_i1.p1  ORF type:complete len:100 (+),score=5.38 TRINITY_DN5232_c0_g1_i1:236-535(+)